MSDLNPSSSSKHQEEKRKKQKSSGFKWKERKNADADDAQIRQDDTLQRGYRERERSPRRDRPGDEDKTLRDGRNDRYRDRDYGRQDETHRPTPDSQHKNDEGELLEHKQEKPPKEKKKNKKPKPVVSNEPMIVVNVNDRLGTKAAIPCLASDSIKAFKAVVAAHIGRQPHEIMLKRQGERPFKDILTLADYGVSNGVQLDLELDTGD